MSCPWWAVPGRSVTARGRVLFLTKLHTSWRSAASFGVALLISACQTVAPVPFRPEDPQTLIGEWSGEGTDSGGGRERWSGKNVLTITRVEGDRVFGTLETWCGGGVSCGHAHTHRTRDVQGVLHGNELKFGHFEVVVDGLHMTGQRASRSMVGYLRLTKQATGTRQPAGSP